MAEERIKRIADGIYKELVVKKTWTKSFIV